METAALIDAVLDRCNAEQMLSPLKTRLVKLLYLTELEYYRRTRKRLTDLDWKFHHFGPYASILGSYLGDPNIDTIAWSIQGRQQTIDHDIQRCLVQVVNEWGRADLDSLLDYVYFDTEPMQAAQRGDALDFSVVKPISDQAPTKIELDSKKLKELRRNLTARAADYDKLRQPSEVSAGLIENLREWDLEGTIKLGQGNCQIDPKSLK